MFAPDDLCILNAYENVLCLIFCLWRRGDAPARLSDHTNAIFKRHNMKSVGYWVPGRCAEFAEPIHLHFGASQTGRREKQLGRVPSRSGMEEGESRIGSERTTG